MDGLIFAIRLTINLVFLLLVQADSIIYSNSAINYHFSHSRSYAYIAAAMDNADANYYVYLQTKDNQFLKKAASLNHLESVYQWYLIQNKKQDISQHVWLQQAVNLGHPPSILIKLKELINQKQWQLADEFQRRHINVLNLFEGQLAKEYQQLQSLLSVMPITSKFTQQNQVSNRLQLTADTDSDAELKCAITIQAIIESPLLIDKAIEFEQALVDSKLNDLSICFLSPKVTPQLQVICQPDQYKRIECDLQQLAQTLSNKTEVNLLTYNHLMVIVDQGDANTRGGLMYLDKDDTKQVFIHELAHWLGYVDEYQLKAKQQQQLCTVSKAKWISPNLFVTPSTMNKTQAEAAAGHDLYLANTCNGSDYKAYKVLAAPSFMEFLDLPLSKQYVQYIKQNIDYTNIMPVSMNFWVHYLAEKDLAVNKEQSRLLQQEYLKWIKVAAAQKFTPAMTLLAQYYIERKANTDAFILLSDAAELNNTNAQLLLGHGYIEGRWLPQNIAKSAYWYQQAAKQNDPYGLYFLAKCYEMGWGCELSLEKAIQYYQQAKSLGSELAIRRLRALASKP